MNTTMPLKWTTEPPKVPGFYFLKMKSGAKSTVYLCEQDIIGKDWRGSVGQWVAIAGPIPEPEESSKESTTDERLKVSLDGKIFEDWLSEEEDEAWKHL